MPIEAFIHIGGSQAPSLWNDPVERPINFRAIPLVGLGNDRIQGWLETLRGAMDGTIWSLRLCHENSPYTGSIEDTVDATPWTLSRLLKAKNPGC